MTPGTISGKAYVARHTEDFERCPAGSILVVRHATPDVVLAFANAIALVSEAGGVTSHAAILAREYGVPCIVGVAGILDECLEGQHLLVRADEGLLEISE